MDTRGLKRWWIAAGAAGVIALAGVALAFGETGVQDEKPADWVRQLSDPDWRVRARAMEALRQGGEDSYKALFSEQNPHPEARFRVALLKKELAPMHGSWSNALEAGRDALDQLNQFRKVRMVT